MKRHVSKTLLMMAFTLSLVGSFVGCKDYDEDVYVDLKSRITKETTLREALQIQVNELEAYVKTLQSCECGLKDYLTKQQADQTYMKTSDYQAKIDQITANETAIALLQKAIDEINDKLRKLNLKDDRVDGIVNQISTMNELILQVQGLAQQALDAARDGKCTCDFTPLQNRIDHLEELIAGWGELITDVSKTANEALTTALKDSIWLVKQQKTIDSLINVINGIDKTVKETIIQRINNLEKNTYTKAEIDKIISELPVAETVDLQPLINRINTIEKNYLTKQEILDLINAIPVADLSSIERRLAILEGKPAVDAYTKSEIMTILAGYLKPSDLNSIYNRLSTLEGKKFWTEAEIKALFPSVYTKDEVDGMLETLANSVYTKGEVYTKTEVDNIINGLNIPDISGLQHKVDSLANLKHTWTAEDIIALIGEHTAAFDPSNIYHKLDSLAALNHDTFTKQEVTNMIQGLQNQIDNLDIPDISVLQHKVDSLSQLKHTWTAEDIIALIGAHTPAFDASNIYHKLDSLAALNHDTYTKDQLYTKDDLYTKSEVDALFQLFGGNVSNVNGKKFWTEDEIKALIPQIPNAYDDQWIKDTLDYYLKKDTLNKYFTKTEINIFIKDLQDQDSIIKVIADSALKVAVANKEAIEGLTTRVGTLEEQMANVMDSIADLKQRMKDVEDRVTILEEVVNTLNERVTKVEEAIEKLTADIQNMITGIIVQGTQNPVVGYLNTPFDARTTLLGVYYGIPDNDWKFPSANSSHYARSIEFEMLERNYNRTRDILGNFVGKISGSAGDMIVTKKDDSYEGNAGTLYLTVNPSNVDFDGQQLKLADSQDKELNILSPLKRSDRTLTMGYTRSADNGFYEAAATITKNDVENMKFEVNMENLQESVKGMFKNDADVYSIVDFGANIIKSLQTELPAWAVKASWTDSIKKTEHKLVSQYNIGAMAVKPLSLAFLQDVKLMNKAPLIEDLEDMVGEIMNEIKINITTDLPDFTDYASKITFTDFSLPEFDEDAFKVSFTKTIDLHDLDEQILNKYFGRDIHFDAGRNGKIRIVFDKINGEYILDVTQNYNDGTSRHSIFRYNDATGTFYQDDDEIAHTQGALEYKLNVQIDKTDDAYKVLNQILAQVNEKIGANGSLSSQVTDLLNEVAEIGNLNDRISVSLGSSKDNIKSILDRYITKLNNKLTDYVNRSTSIMHLALIANNGNKVGILSQVKSNPTDATDFTSLELYPTTYNLELLAPVYKKFVAVSDVFNADGTPANINIAKTANNGTNMAKVVDGSVYCTLQGQSGYIYEVMYTAVDYFGKVGLKKYYVKF